MTNSVFHTVASRARPLELCEIAKGLPLGIRAIRSKTTATRLQTRLDQGPQIALNLTALFRAANLNMAQSETRVRQSMPTILDAPLLANEFSDSSSSDEAPDPSPNLSDDESDGIPDFGRIKNYYVYLKSSSKQIQKIYF